MISLWRRLIGHDRCRRSCGSRHRRRGRTSGLMLLMLLLLLLLLLLVMLLLLHVGSIGRVLIVLRRSSLLLGIGGLSLILLRSVGRRRALRIRRGGSDLRGRNSLLRHKVLRRKRLMMRLMMMMML